jgi:putative membrane protein
MARFSNAISDFRTPFFKNPWLIIQLGVFLILWLYTLAGTTDMANWIIENALTIVFVGTLALTIKRFQFSDLSYLLIFVYICLHVYGAMYTYAENPFGYWLMETFEFSRNHYDRIVHFSFGFLLAYPMRELFLIQMKYPPYVAWLLPIEITLSFSGGYELIEWAVADVFFTEQGAAYLGTQGDIWDAQKDIALAFTGAIVATTIVSSLKRALKIY